MRTRTKCLLPSSRGMGLDIAGLVLTALQGAAQCSQIPYFQEAATLALNIVQIIENVKASNEGFKILAKDSCDLVYAILHTHESNAEVSPMLSGNLKELNGTLALVKAFAEQELRRNLFIRTIRHKSNRERILQYREVLRQALDLFGLKSSISIQENITSILRRQEEILDRLQSGESNSTDEQVHAGHPPAPFPSITACGGARAIHGSQSSVIHGNYITTDMSHHAINVNSGNITNTTTTRSNNDSSMRFYAGTLDADAEITGRQGVIERLNTLPGWGFHDNGEGFGRKVSIATRPEYY